jgi:hypothetical protein
MWLIPTRIIHLKTTTHDYKCIVSPVSIPCIKYVYEIFKYTTEWKLGCENNCICMEIYMVFKFNLPKKIFFKQNENMS